MKLKKKSLAMINGEECVLRDGLGLNRQLLMRKISLLSKFQPKQLTLPRKAFLKWRTD